jgi:hypothetical protein
MPEHFPDTVLQEHLAQLPEYQLRLLIKHRAGVPLPAEVVAIIQELGYRCRLTGWDELDAAATQMPPQLSAVLQHMAENWHLRHQPAR